jgi:hypothetical protein
MKLKKYLQFIKESLKEDLNSGKIWNLNEDQIREFLIETSDAEYLIVVNFGFVEPSIEKDVYTENILSGDEIRPAYWIEISKSKHISNEDVTDSLVFAYSMIEYEGECDVELQDCYGNLNIDNILVKGGFFINFPKISQIELEGNLIIFAKQRKTIKVRPTDLEDYYGWLVSVKKEDQLWAEMDLEDLVDFIISKRSDYREFLIKGQEYMWDYYDISNYHPEINSLFQYYLDSENKTLLVKSIIKEIGGLENTIGHIGDECDNDVYETVKEMSEEELINFLLKERFYSTIEQLASNSDVFSEIKSDVANWEMSAHCNTNWDEIISGFDRIVSDELGQFEKVKKEVTKYYTSKDDQGNQTRKEYKDTVTYYQFPFSNDWISDTDSGYLFDGDLDDLFRDFVRESDIDRNLNPRISDYGHVDKDSMNKDIKAYLKRYLSK